MSRNGVVMPILSAVASAALTLFVVGHFDSLCTLLSTSELHQNPTLISSTDNGGKCSDSITKLILSPHGTPGLCKSLDHCVTLLRAALLDAELSDEVKNEVKAILCKLQSSELHLSSPKIVSIEGLHCSGKTCLGTAMGETLAHTRVYDDTFVFPECILSIYSYYSRLDMEDDEGTYAAVLRLIKYLKLYYILYDIHLNEILSAYTGSTMLYIIVNYYHSLCAEVLNDELYRSSTSSSNSVDVSPANEGATDNEFYSYFNTKYPFMWPFDLVKPKLVSNSVFPLPYSKL